MESWKLKPKEDSCYVTLNMLYIYILTYNTGNAQVAASHLVEILHHPAIHGNV